MTSYNYKVVRYRSHFELTKTIFTKVLKSRNIQTIFMESILQRKLDKSFPWKTTLSTDDMIFNEC